MKEEQQIFHVERTTIEAYFQPSLMDKYRPPSRGGNTKARHQHVIKIAGQTYSFLAAGARKWVLKNDTVSFDWKWDQSGKYRNVVPETIKTWDKNGDSISRGDFDWKPMRSASTRMPGSRRERRD
jgi:hypothetical protein